MAHISRLSDHSKIKHHIGRGKANLATNMLAVCDFNHRFLYLLPGWEGSAHDQRVLGAAFGIGGLKTPMNRACRSSRHK